MRSVHTRLNGTRPSSEGLPDAAAVRSGASLFHRAGHTGRGVELALVDTGVTNEVWFTDRGFRCAGDPDHDGAQHGTGMAAVLFSVAPDIRVLSYRIGDDPVDAFRRACASDADLILAAWGSDGPAPVVDASRCVTVRNSDRPDDWPGGLTDVHVVTESIWPTGPFHCAAVSRPFEGLSVAAAVAAGLAAVLVGAGAAPSEAARLVVSGLPGLSVSETLARFGKD